MTELVDGATEQKWGGRTAPFTFSEKNQKFFEKLLDKQKMCDILIDVEQENH